MNSHDGICRYCGTPVLYWPPPILMHDPGDPKNTGRTVLYRYCRTTVAELTETP